MWFCFYDFIYSIDNKQIINNKKEFGILFALFMADADHGGRQNEKNF